MFDKVKVQFRTYRYIRITQLDWWIIMIRIMIIMWIYIYSIMIINYHNHNDSSYILIYLMIWILVIISDIGYRQLAVSSSQAIGVIEWVWYRIACSLREWGAAWEKKVQDMQKALSQFEFSPTFLFVVLRRAQFFLSRIFHSPGTYDISISDEFLLLRARATLGYREKKNVPR